MSIEVYKLLHLLGIFLVFVGLGGVCARALVAADGGAGVRRLAAFTYGAGLLLILVAGFGQLARLGIPAPGSWGGWVWTKLLLWLALGGLLALPSRRPATARWVWIAGPLAGLMAAWLALFKPF